jgi:hypothetical protein
LKVEGPEYEGIFETGADDAMNHVDAGRHIAVTTALCITALHETLHETLRLSGLRYKALGAS